MTKRWIWVGGAVLVLGLGLAAPWAIGKLTEQQWRETAREVNAYQPFFQLETDEYQRGLFSGQLQGRLLIINPDTGEAHPVDYRGDVSHGLTGSRIELVPSEEDNEALAQLFPEAGPTLTLNTRIWGTARLDLEVPPIQVDDPQTGESLDMEASAGSATISRGGDEVAVNLNWPRTVMRGPDQVLTLEKLRMEQTMARLRGNVWTGEGRVALASASLTNAGGADIILRQLTLVSSSQSSEEESRFSTHSRLALEEAAVDGQGYGPHHVEFVLEDVDVDGWNQVADAFSELQGIGAGGTTAGAAMENRMNAMGALSEALRTVAFAGFSAGFPSLRLASPQGEVSASAMISHPPMDATEPNAMAIVMQRLTGEFRARIPVALGERYPALMLQLASLEQRNLLVRDGDTLKLDASLRDLELTVNDKVIPLPPLI